MSIATPTVARALSLPLPARRRTEPEAFPAVRARAIEWYLPVAVYLARRFAGRGEPVADLTQVAVIGLIKAVDRFDTHRGVPFASYAIPTIVGEPKRHLRDTAWNVRVPRRVQELKLNLATVNDDLAQVLQRSPTTSEVAARLGVTPREVLQARGATTAHRPVSVQQPAGSDDLYLVLSSGRELPQLPPRRPPTPRHHDPAITDTATTMTAPRGPGAEEPPMRINRSAIVAILRKRNLDARADWVEHTLPAIVDIRQHTGLLATLNITPSDLANQRP